MGAEVKQSPSAFPRRNLQFATCVVNALYLRAKTAIAPSQCEQMSNGR
jgi:hypothetical protein